VSRDDAILTQKLTHRRNAGKSGTNQGTLTKGEDPVQYASSLIFVVFEKRKMIFKTQKESVACAINTIQSSYDDHHEWHLYYKCVLALALV
jgi:hypothetical protein